MTMTELKEHPPDVKIRIRGKDYVGHIRGRLLDFPMVYVHELDASYEYSWLTLLDAVNHNVILTI